MKSRIAANTETAAWVKYIKLRVEQDRNYLGMVTGETGSGKSDVCLSVASMIDPTFHVGRVCFSFRDIFELIKTKELRRGRVAIYEEASVEGASHKWYTQENQSLAFLMQVCRDENFIILFNTPYMDMFMGRGRKLLKGYWECLKVDKENKTCKVKPFVLQYNEWQGRIYKKYLQVYSPGKGFVKLKRWHIPESDPELRKEYEKKKKDFKLGLYAQIEQVMASGGVKKPVRYDQKCLKCGHEWASRLERPSRCAACQTNLAVQREKGAKS